MGSLVDIELMPCVRHVRLQDDEDNGMLGVYIIAGQLFCCVLEPPDRANASNISCIPEGQYICKRYRSNRFNRELFQIMDVPGRTAIAIHSGNVVGNTNGCHLLGSHWEKLQFHRQVANSGKTLESFMQIMHGINKFHLTIVNCF